MNFENAFSAYFTAHRSILPNLINSVNNVTIGCLATMLTFGTREYCAKCPNFLTKGLLKQIIVNT